MIRLHAHESDISMNRVPGYSGGTVMDFHHVPLLNSVILHMLTKQEPNEMSI